METKAIILGGLLKIKFIEKLFKSIEFVIVNLIYNVYTNFNENYQYKVFDVNYLFINKIFMLKKYKYIQYESSKSEKNYKAINYLNWPRILQNSYALIIKKKIKLIFTFFKD